jgi:hypothetical protein
MFLKFFYLTVLTTKFAGSRPPGGSGWTMRACSQPRSILRTTPHAASDHSASRAFRGQVFAASRRSARRRFQPATIKTSQQKISIATVANPAYVFTVADSALPARASAAKRRSALPPDRGVAFVSIIPLLANSSFDPEAVEILSGAFDDAWEQIKQSGSDFARPAYERGAREVLAKYIIELAQRGERDRRQLSEAAVKYLAQNYKQ